MAGCSKPKDLFIPLKQPKGRNYSAIGIARENIPHSISVYLLFLTQNLTQNRKNWVRTERTQPSGFGRFCPKVGRKALKRNVRTNRQQLITRRSEVQVLLPQPEIRWNPDSSGLFLFSATFLRGLFLAFKSDPDSDPYGNFSGLERAINCRRGRVPWPPPPAAGPRWSRGRRCPG